MKFMILLVEIMCCNGVLFFMIGIYVIVFSKSVQLILPRLSKYVAANHCTMLVTVAQLHYATTIFVVCKLILFLLIIQRCVIICANIIHCTF